MKTLAELRTEVEAGMRVYPVTHHDVTVVKVAGMYAFLRDEDGTRSEHFPWRYSRYKGMIILDGDIFDADETYDTFDDLLYDWPRLSSQAVWSTAKSLARIAYEDQRQAFQHDPSNPVMLDGVIVDTFPDPEF